VNDDEGGVWVADRLIIPPGPRHLLSGSFHSRPSHHT
jgi:hypothetical protein